MAAWGLGVEVSVFEVMASLDRRSMKPRSRMRLPTQGYDRGPVHRCLGSKAGDLRLPCPQDGSGSEVLGVYSLNLIPNQTLNPKP